MYITASVKSIKDLNEPFLYYISFKTWHLSQCGATLTSTSRRFMSLTLVIRQMSTAHTVRKHNKLFTDFATDHEHFLC